MNRTITDLHRDLHHMAHMTLLADTSLKEPSTAVNRDTIARNQAVGTRLSVLVHSLHHRLVLGVIRLLELTDFLVNGHKTWIVFADESASWCLSVS